MTEAEAPSAVLPGDCPDPQGRITKERKNSPTLRVSCDNCSFRGEVVTYAAASALVAGHMLGDEPPSPEVQLRMQLGSAGLEDMGLWKEYVAGCVRYVGHVRWWLSPDYVAAARGAFQVRIRDIARERLRDDRRARTRGPA